MNGFTDLLNVVFLNLRIMEFVHDYYFLRN